MTAGFIISMAAADVTTLEVLWKRGFARRAAGAMRVRGCVNAMRCECHDSGNHDLHGAGGCHHGASYLAIGALQAEDRAHRGFVRVSVP